MTNYASPEEYNLADLLCCAASREVQDNEIVFAGTGLPMVAIMLAQKTHAPNLKLIFEAGTLDGRPPVLDHLYLGPTANINISMNSLKMFLAQHGIAVTRGIDYCQIPFRQR